MSFKKILLYLRVIMPLIFLSLGLYCLIFPERVRMEMQYSQMFGAILIVYGLFRGYRAWKDVRNEGN